MSKKILYYFIAGFVFVLLKIWFKQADTDDLYFLLKPTDKLVGFLTGNTSNYIQNYGFFYEEINIVIEKSCSGFQFMLICFLMLSFLFLKYIKKFYVVFTSFFLAYIFTVLVNTSRIVVSIICQKQLYKIIALQSRYILHEIIGIITYLTFLILIYLFFENQLKKRNKNEKLSKT